VVGDHTLVDERVDVLRGQTEFRHERTGVGAE
jgi:hypothetical protein